jgi:hypothetical protein
LCDTVSIVGRRTLLEVTEQDVELVHDMVRDMAATQFKQFGEAPPFFAALGSKEPERLEELTKVGGLPLKMEQVTKGKGPVLIGFYLASVPAQLWHGLMSAIADDINATALVFTNSTTIADFPNDEGQGEAEVSEWYKSHSDITDYPDKSKAIVVNVHRKDQPSTLEVAIIDGDTQELGKFSVEKGRNAKGDVKW